MFIYQIYVDDANISVLRPTCHINPTHAFKNSNSCLQTDAFHVPSLDCIRVGLLSYNGHKSTVYVGGLLCAKEVLWYVLCLYATVGGRPRQNLPGGSEINPVLGGCLE